MTSSHRVLSVAVVQGGPSSEAEVSRASAKSVAAALEQAGHRTARVELDPYLADSLRTGGYDVVFPVVHGAVGEDGCLQGLLEIVELPYVGSRTLGSALAMDKPVARQLFQAAGLPVAKGTTAQRGEDKHQAAERVLRTLGSRLVVKPGANGSAIGVARLREATVELLGAALDGVWQVDETALIEQFAVGQEVTCGVLATPTPTALPPTLIHAPNDAFYTYEARYAAGRSTHECPAPLPPDVFAQVQAVAVQAFGALSCRDLARADFVVGDLDDANKVTLLEINTMPGFTATSLFPEAAQAAGIPFPELVHRLVTQAYARGLPSRNIPRPLP